MDEDNDLQKLYDKFLDLAEFPGSNEPTPKAVYLWHQKLDTFYSIMENFADSGTIYRIKEIKDQLDILNSNPRGHDFFIIKGYHLLMDYFGAIANIFVSNSLMDNPMGETIIKDLLNKAYDYQRNTIIYNSASLWYWQSHIEALNAILKEFKNKDYLKNYGIIERELTDDAKLYPSDEWVFRTVKTLNKYIELIVKFLNDWDPNILIPLNITKNR